MRIVQFSNGKYAVKRGWWIFSSYLDDAKFICARDVWWPYILGFWKTESLVETAEKARRNYQEHVLRMKNKKSNLKVINSWRES